jgi:anti-anti-sigma factor
MTIRKTSRNEMRSPVAPDEPLPPSAEHRRQGPAPFEATAFATPEELLVRITSPMCADNIPECGTGLRQITACHPAPMIVLDMSACPFMDTPGLAVLVETRKNITSAQRTLWIQAPSRSVARMLSLTKMTRLFPIRPAQPNPEGAESVWPLTGH